MILLVYFISIFLHAPIVDVISTFVAISVFSKYLQLILKYFLSFFQKTACLLNIFDVNFKL